MLYVAYGLVLGGALLLATQKTLKLLCQKTSSASRLCRGVLDVVDRKALKAGMLIVRDPKTHTEFRVDSGSRRSMTPYHRPATHPSINGFMCNRNGSEVPTFESIEIISHDFTITLFILTDKVIYPLVCSRSAISA